MKATLYITRTRDMIRFGEPASVTLYEYPMVSRTWTRRVVVELPDGFRVAKSNDIIERIYCGSDCYELHVDAKENPVIIDHTRWGGPFIPLTILSEGWDI